MTKGTAPISGYHAGRLAVEQTYGYMVRNGKQIGVLTTVNGFVFLFRENQGKLVYDTNAAMREHIADSTTNVVLLVGVGDAASKPAGNGLIGDGDPDPSGEL